MPKITEMGIFTGSYNKQRGITHPIGVGISASVPHWFTGPVYKKVAPPMDLVHRYKGGHATPAEYIEIYFAHLKQFIVTAEVIVSDLRAYGDSVVLLCWEGRGQFCHRMILAKLLMSSGLVNPIKELG